MPTVTEAFAGFRLLTTEPTGPGRRRLLSAAPARQSRGRWVPSDRSMDDERRAPCALQRPDGQVEEFDSGFVFDSRLDFLRARGAAT